MTDLKVHIETDRMTGRTDDGEVAWSMGLWDPDFKITIHSQLEDGDDTIVPYPSIGHGQIMMAASERLQQGRYVNETQDTAETSLEGAMMIIAGLVTVCGGAAMLQNFREQGFPVLLNSRGKIYNKEKLQAANDALHAISDMTFKLKPLLDGPLAGPLVPKEEMH